MNAGEITRKSGSSFSWAFFGLRREQRSALQALYAFCRVVDDIVDEGGDPRNAKAGLDRWRHMLDRLDDPSAFDSPLAWELSQACQKFPIALDDLRKILDGVEMDLACRRYETFDDLLVYCDSVASAVGLATLAILGADREKTFRYAQATGRALQLTNILRDVKSDASRGRVYLPQADLARFRYTDKDLTHSKYNEKFVQVMAFEAGRARQLYRESRESLAESERRKFPSAEVMRKTYEALLDCLEERRFNVFREKVRLPAPRKWAIAMSVWLPHFLRPRA